MNRRGFLTALIGGTVASTAATVGPAHAQFFMPFESPPDEWEDRRDRYDRYRRERYRREREWERERRRRYEHRRWEDDEDEDE